MRIRRLHIILGFVLALVIVATLFLSFRTVSIGGFERGTEDSFLGLKLGLDLQGGTHLVYRAEDPNVTEDQMEGLLDVIENRVNAFGVSEPLIQRSGSNEIIIQLPGVANVDEAKQLVGQTAQLDFRECRDDSCSQNIPALAEGNGGVQKHLTGGFLRPTATLVRNSSTGYPEVSFEFDTEGARMFEQITRRNIQQRIGIFVDNRLISAPTVQAVISRMGRITGLSNTEAQLLSLQLNSGALPVGIKVARELDVSATLGSDSLKKSYAAAAIGLGLVALFMLAYYRMLGVVSILSLATYAILVLSMFKLFGVVLELSGVAAFVISFGMAVDANVIIFERSREELRAGRTLAAAVEVGFDRAWNAIRDANVTTFIVMAILWWFGDQLSEPRVIGFAITLTIAIATSMFTGFVVSRNLLRLIVATGFATKTKLFVNTNRSDAIKRPNTAP